MSRANPTPLAENDEKGALCTVALEVWTDGPKVTSTGVLTGAMPAQPLTADATGPRWST